MPVNAQSAKPPVSGMRSALMRATRNGELFLEFQPIVDAATLSVGAVEALIRWHHPLLGVLEAGDFIANAEAAGCVTALDMWAAETGVRQAARWAREGRDITVHINAAAPTVEDRQFVMQIERWIAETSLSPDRMVLELTERMAARGGRALERTLDGLRDIGCGLALDDFGSGLSSLSRLARLPVTHLKLDRSFIDGMATERGNALVAGVVTLAHGLGLPVTAEGVESAAQFAAVQATSADNVQGHLIARPMPAQDTERLQTLLATLPGVPEDNAALLEHLALVREHTSRLRSAGAA